MAHDRHIVKPPASPAQQHRSEGVTSTSPTLRKWDEVVEPLIAAVRDSERLTEHDFAIRINTLD